MSSPWKLTHGRRATSPRRSAEVPVLADEGRLAEAAVAYAGARDLRLALAHPAGAALAGGQLATVLFRV